MMALATASASTPVPSSDDERTRAVLQALAQPVPSNTRFVERRESGLLDEPLILRGEMARPDADRLVRSVLAPYSERSEIHGERVVVTREDGRERRFSLRRAPALAALRDGLQALLSGDAQALQASFEVTLEEAAADPADASAAWRFTMRPHAARVAEHIERLEAVGRGDTLRCLLTHEADGSVSWLLLGEASEAELPDFEGECGFAAAAGGPDAGNDVEAGADAAHEAGTGASAR
ncbi:LolA-related protein [Alkalisalibacterium limincola]|uniref:Outer membrane lipoprotein carrier protein LolA n=1 Tax=Alkalisalibacterium limincola TaxID=2699169 RepID=A0A5C8KNU2_9GAMM|nr:LolA-related protein [Alkalisalibacterium limincola]TXK62278.1 hypothetical protein FU658_08540 [Alkalisalibacterium limincola]